MKLWKLNRKIKKFIKDVRKDFRGVHVELESIRRVIAAFRGELNNEIWIGNVVNEVLTQQRIMAEAAAKEAEQKLVQEERDRVLPPHLKDAPQALIEIAKASDALNHLLEENGSDVIVSISFDRFANRVSGINFVKAPAAKKEQF